MVDYDTPVLSPDVIGFPGTSEQIQNMFDPSNVQTSTTDQVLRRLRFKQMGVTGAGDLFVNWLLEEGVTVSGIQTYADNEDTGQGILGYLQGQIGVGDAMSGGKINTWDLHLKDGKAAFLNHLKATWTTIPDLKERLRIAYEDAGGGVGAFLGDEDELTPEALQVIRDTAHGIMPDEIGGAEALVPPKKAPTEPGFVEPISEVSHEQPLGFQFDQVFGGDIPLFGGASGAQADAIFQKVAGEYVDEIARQSRYVLAETMASVDVDGEAVSSLDAQPIQTFVLSYDGTAQGEVNSMVDLYSNGQLGYLDWSAFLYGLEERTAEESNGLSMTIAKIQQEMYATGYLKSRPTEWGRLSITEFDPTVAAVGAMQLDMLAEMARLGGNLVGEERIQTMLQMDPRMVMDSMLMTQYKDRLQPIDERALQDNIAAQVQDMAETMIGERGRSISASGQQRLAKTLSEVLGEVDPADAERLWGEGGLPEELALANAVLTEYYGVDDWENSVTFGHNDSDRSAAKYARGVGAITQEEYDKAMMAGRSPDARHTALTRNPKIGKDIATSHFLRELGQELAEGQSLADATAEQIQGALMGYSYSLGQRKQFNEMHSSDDFFQMASRAQSRIPLLSAPDPALGEMTEEVMNRLGIQEAVAGTGFDSYLRGLNVAGRPLVHSRIPNA